jgi:hypothetical protein
VPLSQPWSFSKHALEAIALRKLSRERILDVLMDNQGVYKVISDTEAHVFFKDGERCLKVVVTPRDKRIITAYHVPGRGDVNDYSL